ncbi:MAG: lysine-2,3-aminomutase-like protein [Rhizobiaceae bacterium]|nr:lysine-2,3-aminomutase-like protein [Rhizobiaceae bacterium]
MMVARSITTVDELVAAGLISAGEEASAAAVAEHYAIAVTPAMTDLIDPSDPHDPIAAQFVPTAAELVRTEEERDDPIGDRPFTPLPGIVHRYPDRVLLKVVHVCPVYCRFCFRREMVGPQGDGTLTAEQLAAALDYIRANAGIWEVILTGGDPLVLSARRLADIMRQLATIPHVKIVRIHSRVPVVDPERIDDTMIDALKQGGKTVYVALHANHPRELSETARHACARLIDAGVVMVSQTVLLKGVNDDLRVLEELMRAFVESRIKPYYLHHPDLAPGTGHFRMSITEGQALVRALRARLSGLCIPAYILDIPGGHGKVEISERALAGDPDAGYCVTDPQGKTHPYPVKK